ncbi:MAG: hypothetical protein GY717_04890 [Rhodobacteraceae bacterium]|nr:hypothetical protein [Paracoccaceae bacterium]
MIRLILILALAIGVSSCGKIQNTFGIGGAGAKGKRNVVINDRRFRTSISPGEDRRDITITVKPVSVDPAAALEAGRYKATVYCLRSYGGSDTEWSAGPDQPIEQLGVSGDTVTLRGRCTQR